MREIKITDREENQRLDKFMLKVMNTAPKSFVYKMLRKKRIKLNGKKAEGNELLQAGDTLQLYLAEETVTSFQEERQVVKAERQFEIVYEDTDVLLVNKPAGLLVHPENDKDNQTLIDQVLYYLVETGFYVPQTDTGFTPALCNRLDRNTSGLVVVGKTLRGTQGATAAIRERRVRKFYYTIVRGNIQKAGEITAYLSKDMTKNQVHLSPTQTDGGKGTKTKYRPLLSNREYTLLEIELITGKTHQIRAHMQYLGHPIIGDRKYGESRHSESNGMNKTAPNHKPYKAQAQGKTFGLSNQLLHAARLVWEKDEVLTHLSGKTFKAPLPEQFLEVAKRIFGEQAGMLD